MFRLDSATILKKLIFLKDKLPHNVIYYLTDKQTLKIMYRRKTESFNLYSMLSRRSTVIVV